MKNILVVLLVFFMGCNKEDPYIFVAPEECVDQTNINLLKRYGGKVIKEDVLIYGKEISNVLIMYNLDYADLDIDSYGFTANYDRIIDSFPLWRTELIKHQESVMNIAEGVSINLEIGSIGCKFNCTVVKQGDKVMTCWQKMNRK